MKCLVIGSDGFVGRNLLERQQANYFGFDNGFLQGELLFETQYIDITKDMDNLNNWLKKNKEDFLVINLSAIHHIPYCNKNPAEAVMTNVYGNMKLYELIASYGCKKYIFSSSGAVYNPQLSDHLETDLMLGSDVYSSTKILAENYLSEACKRLNTPVLVLRFFNIAGKYDLTPHLIPDIVDQILDPTSNEIKVGNLNTIRDYINVDDICNVIEMSLLKLMNDQYEVLNVGSGRGFSGLEVFEMIKNITKTNKNKRIDVNRFRTSDRPVQIANIENLIKKFPNYRPLSFEHALRSYLQWRGVINNVDKQ